MRLPLGCRPSRITSALFAGAAAAGVMAQEPPRPLPATVTGRPAPAAVQPAAAVAPAAAPIQRFQNFQTLPPDAVQSVYAMRAGADWLWRMNQPNGRFVPGLDPALKRVVADDPDGRQAAAALALARAARFTGDERFTARAAQAVLTLRTLCKPDPADPASLVPPAGGEPGARLVFAARLALAAYDLPGADPKLLADAGALAHFLATQCRPDGAVADGPADLDPVQAPDAAGLALQALAAAERAAPDPTRRAVLARAVPYYAGWFRGQPEQLPMAAALLPAVAEVGAQFRDAGAQALVIRMADALCDHQLTPATAGRRGWAGGFTPVAARGAEPAPPGVGSAVVTEALAAAARLTREQTGDLSRHGRYRHATEAGLQFCRGLQFTTESADHFEKEFRARYLIGGAHLSPADGTVRADATAAVVLAHLRYLDGGAERRE